MRLFITFFVIAVNFLNMGMAEDEYCVWAYSHLCRHFANEQTLCGATGQFVERCPQDARRVHFNESLIMDFINKKRQEVAKGSLNTQPAAKMNKVHWCKELAKIAHLSVLQCNQEEQFCSKTNLFRTADIYKREYTFVDSATPVDFPFIEKLWQNFKNAYENYFDDFTNKLDRKAFAYFTHDRTTHIGCSAVRYTFYAEHKVLFACAFSHVPNQLKPFEEGAPASRCPSGKKHAHYKGLCALLEEDLKKVDPVC